MSSTLGTYGHVIPETALPPTLGSLGGGNPAQVHDLGDPVGGAPIVYKHYRTREPLDRVRRLAALGARLLASHRQLMQHTTWPINPVVADHDPTQMVGVVLPTIPDAGFFELRMAGRIIDDSTLRTIEYACVPSPAVYGLADLDRSQRIRIARTILRLGWQLEELGIVYPDVSYGNLIGLDDAYQRVLLIDVDAAAIGSRPDLCSHGFDEPDARADRIADHLTARRRFALLAARVLIGTMDTPTGARVHQILGLPGTNPLPRLLDAALGSRGSRPALAQLDAALDQIGKPTRPTPILRTLLGAPPRPSASASSSGCATTAGTPAGVDAWLRRLRQPAN